MWEWLRHRSGRQQRKGQVNPQPTVQSAQPPTMSEPSNLAPPLAADNSPGVPTDDQQHVGLAKARAVAQAILANNDLLEQLPSDVQEALRGLLAADAAPEQIEHGKAAVHRVESAIEAARIEAIFEKLPQNLRAWYRPEAGALHVAGWLTISPRCHQMALPCWMLLPNRYGLLARARMVRARWLGMRHCCARHDAWGWMLRTGR